MKQRVDKGEEKKMRRKDEERREARERERERKIYIYIYIYILMEGREKFNKIIFFLALMNNAHLSIDTHCSNGAKKL